MYPLGSEQKDYLTGFYHREALKPFLRDILLESKSGKRPFSIVFMDMDSFKQYNDKYGHSFGDLILKYFSGTLRVSIEGENCFVFRYGGDEFVAVFPGKSVKQTMDICGKIMHNLATRPFVYENRVYTVTMSGGLATFPTDGQEMWELLEKADEALYFSKNHGHNRVTPFEETKHLAVSSPKGFKKLFIFLLTIAVCVGGYYTLIKPNVEAIRVFIDEKISDLTSSLSIPTKKGLDVIVLKDGTVLEGYILEETSSSVTLRLHMDTGQGQLRLDKSEVNNIQRRGNETDQAQDSSGR